MLIRDLMTADVEMIDARASVRDAAARMQDLNVGFMPVQEEDSVVGLITDRDITMRAVAQGMDSDLTSVSEIMTTEMWCLPEDRDVEEAARLMSEKQIRRILVLDEQGRMVGVLALGDLAVHAHNASLVGSVLERVSEPAEPVRV